MELKKRKAKKKTKRVFSKHNGKQLYKVVTIDGNPNQTYSTKFQYDLPANGKPGKWKDHPGTLLMCSRGLHLTNSPIAWLHDNGTDRVFEAEYRGQIVVSKTKLFDNDKICCRSIRLVREVAVVRIDRGRFKVRPFTAAEKKLHEKKIASADKLIKLSTEAQNIKDNLGRARARAVEHNWHKRNAAIRAIGRKFDKKERSLIDGTAAKQKQVDVKYNAMARKLGAKDIDSGMTLHIKPKRKPRE